MPDWTPDEAETLLSMRGQGAGPAAIGRAIGKTRSAVAGRINRLGLPLIQPEQGHPGARGRYKDRW